MTSFISALSLFILVLSNGCFTLPIVDEYFLSSTLSSLNDDLTTEKLSKSLVVLNDETTVIPIIEPKLSVDDHIGLVVSSSSDDLLSETTIPTSLTDKSDREDLSLTTQSSEHEPQTLLVDSLKNESTTTELPVELTTDFLPSFTSTSSVAAPELYTSTSAALAPELYTSESFTSTLAPELYTSTSSALAPELHTSESFTSTSTLLSTAVTLPATTEEDTSLPTDTDHPDKVKSGTDIREPIKSKDISKPRSKATTVKTYTARPKISTHRTSSTPLPDKSNEDSEKTQTELTTEKTRYVPIFDKSNEDSEKTRTELITEKTSYIPSFDKSSDEADTELPTEETELQPEEIETETELPTEETETELPTVETEIELPKKKKPRVQLPDNSSEKSEETQTELSKKKKLHVQLPDKIREDSKEFDVATAEFDQSSVKKVLNVPDDFMILQENDEIVVSILPDQSSTHTTEEQFSRKPLKQGKKSSQFKAQEPNY